LNEVTADVHPHQTPIDTVVNTIDYRGNPKFAPAAMLGNVAITLTSPPFTLPFLSKTAGPREHRQHFSRSLYAIASSIRQGTDQSRDPKFLEPYLQFHSNLCKRCYQENLFQCILPASEREVTFNSSHALNWRKAADFYEPGSEYAEGRYTTFHTSLLVEKYIRLFPTNPVFVPDPTGKSRGSWDTSLDGGLEAAFRLDKSVADMFERRVKQSMEEWLGKTAATL